MLTIKKGVRFAKLSPQMVLAAITTYAAFHALGVDCTITGGTEPGHDPRLLHPRGGALDFRIHHVSRAYAQTLTDQIARALGDNYDVILKRDHIHIEYDPA